MGVRLRSKRERRRRTRNIHLDYIGRLVRSLHSRRHFSSYDRSLDCGGYTGYDQHADNDRKHVYIDQQRHQSGSQ